MPGTPVRDANASNLLTGATLNAAGSTDGTAVEKVWPKDVRFELVTGTVTGTSPTLLIQLQGADNAAFDSGVVSFGEFPVTSGTAASQSSKRAYLDTYVDKRYVRAKVTLGGTNPVYTGSTLTAVPKHTNRAKTDGATLA